MKALLPKRKFVRSPADELEMIGKFANQNALCFQELQEKDDFSAVRAFREKIERIFQDCDARMSQLLSENIPELTNWASRMRLAREKMDELDRNLVFCGKRQFNWPSVLQAMGMLDALRVGAQQTLGENGVDC